VSTCTPDPDRYVTVEELDQFGLTARDVRIRCPWAAEYTALDGTPCWVRDDLNVLLATPSGGDEA
jgi:hypothetical protein